MKRTLALLALALAAALALSGCAAMLDRSAGSATPHVDYPVAEEESTLRAETYQGLVNSILYYVNEHSSTGSIQLYNYDGDVEEDLDRACADVLEEDPLAAYAVSALTCEHTRILTYYEVDVRVTYAHTAEELEAIRPVSGLAGLRAELTRFLEERPEEDVFLLSYFSGGLDTMEEQVRQILLGRPELWLLPGGSGGSPCRFQCWPEAGARRVVRAAARWADSAEELAGYGARLAEAADGLLAANPPAGEGYTVQELAAVLRAAAGPLEDRGSDLALDALSGQPASETGLLLALEYLCQRAGVEVIPVAGERGGDWLIAATPEGYRHVLPEDCAPAEDGAPWTLPLYTDGELRALGGRSWPAALYPVCGEEDVEAAPAPEDTGEMAG